SEVLLGSVRLLTLTGPGGVGKTRLVLAVASAVATRFADGVLFVPLAPLRDASSITAALARALGGEQRLDRAVVDDVKEALRPRQSLLVFDNFEHLTPAASLLTELLSVCPRLTILVTSRVRLHLSGEHDVPVPMLPLPEADLGSSMQSLR